MHSTDVGVYHEGITHPCSEVEIKFRLLFRIKPEMLLKRTEAN